MRLSLIVHGGAWRIPDQAVVDCQSGCRRALEAGWRVLRLGGPALDAVEAAIVILEDEPIFDAGTGSHLNRDGRVELDAIIMDGATLNAGSVAAVGCVRNPIRLARRVLESSPHMMLVGAGAEQFAREQGVPVCAPEELIVERERATWRQYRADPTLAERRDVVPTQATGTVGAVAYDARGRLAAGTSTGGTLYKHPGRVGDSPLIGCGCYVDDEAGGVSATGEGEAIMRIVMAKTAVESLRSGQSPRATADSCLTLLRDRGRGVGGLILIDRSGTVGFAHTTPRMAYGYVTRDGEFVVPEMPAQP
jgi:L-asparaginase / beta-aspartyl-peptidase